MKKKKRAMEIGDSANFEISRASGGLESYTIRWNNFGVPVIIVCPVPFPSTMFFFSSRRRHTRSKRDWSSDVCSSDLRGVGLDAAGGVPAEGVVRRAAR